MFGKILSQVKANQYPTADGISFLEAKHLLLLSYCQSLAYYLLRKAKGLSIEGHPVVRSLVEIRLFLEKVWEAPECSPSYCYLVDLYTDCTFSFETDPSNRQKTPVSNPKTHKSHWHHCKQWRCQWRGSRCFKEVRGSIKISSQPRHAC